MKAQFLARWQFQASVLAPVVLSLLVTAATVLAFVLWATSDLDERSLQREMQLASHILVLDDGEVVQHGTHQDLLAHDGLYKHLYEKQLVTEAQV